MVFPFIGDIDMSTIKLGQMQTSNGKQSVEIACNATKNGKLYANLCKDVRAPMPAKYQLDMVRDDSDGSRRGLIVCIDDPDVAAALKALDDLVVAAAVANCKEWFKKSALTETEVRARYRPLLFKAQEEDDFSSTKFKVKCTKFPTKLHLQKDDDTIVADGGRIEHLEDRGALLAPIVSIFGLWFMGGGSSFGIGMQAEEMVVTPGKGTVALSNFLSKRPLEVVRAAPELEGDEQEGKRVCTEEPVLVEGE